MENKKRILVVAPHPDDETLGVGGTIAKFAARGDEVFVLMVSGHLPPLYNREDYEKTVSEACSAFSILGVFKSEFLEIPATMIGDQPLHKFNVTSVIVKSSVLRSLYLSSIKSIAHCLSLVSFIYPRLGLQFFLTLLIKPWLYSLFLPIQFLGQSHKLCQHLLGHESCHLLLQQF